MALDKSINKIFQRYRRFVSFFVVFSRQEESTARFNKKNILSTAVHQFKHDRRQRENRKWRYYVLITAYTRKKSILANLLTLMVNEEENRVRLPRSCRRYLRNTGGWKNVFSNYSDEGFKKSFKLSKPRDF